MGALFPIFEFQNFTDAYLGKVTKFQFNCFSCLDAAFKKPGGDSICPPSPIRVKSESELSIARPKRVRLKCLDATKLQNMDYVTQIGFKIFNMIKNIFAASNGKKFHQACLVIEQTL